MHRHVGLARGLGGRCVEFLEHDDEFVAAEAGDGVVLAHSMTENDRDLHQQVVTLVMPHGVVDRLEVAITMSKSRSKAMPRGQSWRPRSSS